MSLDVEPTYHPEPPFGAYVEAGNPARRWFYRQHLFAAIQRVDSRVLKGFLEEGQAPFAEFRSGLDQFDVEHLVEWSHYGSAVEPRHCFPAAVAVNDYTGWPPAAERLGAVVNGWIEQNRLIASADDPLWVIEAGLYNLGLVADGHSHMVWYVPTHVCQERFFDDVSLVLPPWNPQRESKVEWRRKVNKITEAHERERLDGIAQLKKWRILEERPRFQVESAELFEALVRFQVLNEPRARNSSLDSARKAQERAAREMRLVLRGSLKAISRKGKSPQHEVRNHALGNEVAG